MSFMMKKIAIIFLLVAGCINSNTFAQNNIKMSLYSNLMHLINAIYLGDVKLSILKTIHRILLFLLLEIPPTHSLLRK